MLHEIKRETSDQPHCQEFGLERLMESGTVRDHMSVCNSELSISVYCGGPHEIARPLHQFRMRLQALRQTVDDMFEQPQAFVGAADHKFFRTISALLLPIYVLLDSFQVGCGRQTVVQSECRVPSRRDHPVSTFRFR